MTETEINRRVALALGWWVQESPLPGHKGACLYHLVAPNGKREFLASAINKSSALQCFPKFTTDPAAADLVRQEIERRGWRYFIQRWDSHWDMEIYHDDFPDVFVQSHTSYYELLCLAFLAAREASTEVEK